MNALTKQSTNGEIKQYFAAVLNLSNSNEEFPVNLDDVWPLVYARKDKAVRALKDDELFIEGIDYKPLPQNGERSDSGQFSGENKVTYLLTVPCLEFFIARKVRPVFEVYRQVFHNAAKADPKALQQANDRASTLRTVLNALQKDLDTNAAQLSVLTEALTKGAEPRQTYIDTVMDDDYDVPTFAVADDYGMTDHDFNVLLASLGLVRRAASQWVFPPEQIIAGHVKFHTYTCFREDNSEVRRPRFDWTKKGRIFLYNLLKSHGILPTIEQTAPQAEEDGRKEAYND